MKNNIIYNDNKKTSFIGLNKLKQPTFEKIDNGISKILSLSEEGFILEKKQVNKKTIYKYLISLENGILKVFNYENKQTFNIDLINTVSLKQLEKSLNSLSIDFNKNHVLNSQNIESIQKDLENIVANYNFNFDAIEKELNSFKNNNKIIEDSLKIFIKKETDPIIYNIKNILQETSDIIDLYAFQISKNFTNIYTIKKEKVSIIKEDKKSFLKLDGAVFKSFETQYVEISILNPNTLLQNDELKIVHVNKNKSYELSPLDFNYNTLIVELPKNTTLKIYSNSSIEKIIKIRGL